MSNLPYDYGPLCMRYCVHIHILCATLDNPTKQPSLHSDLCMYGTKVSYRAQLAFLLGWHTQQWQYFGGYQVAMTASKVCMQWFIYPLYYTVSSSRLVLSRSCCRWNLAQCLVMRQAHTIKATLVRILVNCNFLEICKSGAGTCMKIVAPCMHFHLVST